ncbi:MAG: phage major capsid protein, partial [Synechococcaceae bacterium WB9_3_282]|nr:phage major capsid protein [Synechococcaceae bacterium WB9_3_282]
AFIPKLVVQLYNSTPLMAALIANSQQASGGVSQVTVPVQGAQFVNAQWSDYSGSFTQPAVQQGAYNAEFNLKLMIAPVPFLGMEGAVQQDYAIIPLIEARMNDATNVMMDAMATALYNNTTNTQQFIGLPGAIDDGTNLVTYGNINRNTYTWWKSKVYAAGGVNPTRQNVLQYISGTVKNGAEVPTFGVCGFGTWTLLAQDYVGQEQYVITPNSNYLSLYIHDQGSFVFTGFESTLPNWQIGYVGAVLMIAELVSTKPKSMTRVSGYNSISL